MEKDDKMKELTVEELGEVAGGSLIDKVPTVDEHDYDDDIKEKVKAP